jgi:pyruvate formate lyase activating enzyme
MSSKLPVAARGAWLLVAVYYFYMYALRSAPRVMMPELTEAFGVDNFRRVPDFCAGLKNLERGEILRFHQLGRPKWEWLNLDYPLKDTEPPSAGLTERVRGQFRNRGLTVY